MSPLLLARAAALPNATSSFSDDPAAFAPSPAAPPASRPDPDHIRGRVALSSAANLLLVVLLRLNHWLAPLLVACFRRRRVDWISKVTRDVAAELRRDPDMRTLCAGACCRVGYGTFETDGAPGDGAPAPADREVGPGGPSSTIVRWIRAVAFSGSHTTSEHEIGAAAAFTKEDARDGVLGNEEGDASGGAPSEADLYFRLRVEQEQRHRRLKVSYYLDESVIRVYVMFFTFVIYSVAIVAAVQLWFRLPLWELAFFSASLVCTGMLAEGRTIRLGFHMLLAGHSAVASAPAIGTLGNGGLSAKEKAAA